MDRIDRFGARQPGRPENGRGNGIENVMNMHYINFIPDHRINSAEKDRKIEKDVQRDEK